MNRDALPQPVFFATPGDFRRWLAKHHASADELLVGFHKKGTGEASITWPESVDEALCFGWIDGIRRRLDDRSYTIRFTPRKPRSTWSRRNIDRAEAMIAAGRMKPAGLAAFEARKEHRSGTYSYEQRKPELAEPYKGMLKKDPAAWKFFRSQPPSYRKTVSWWIARAKKEETRLRRLENLRRHSALGERIPQYLSRESKGAKK